MARFEKSVSALLAGASKPAEAKAARAAWVRSTCAAWRAAMRAMDATCDAAAARLSEAEFEKLIEAEQAKVDAVRAEVDAVVERDVWPRALYFGGI
jgi:hypothetical protein